MCPRLVVAALRGGSGKTVLSLGLCSLWQERYGGVVPFKKGPDYIDAAWLGLAAGSPCRHLDPYLMSKEQILSSLCRHTRAGEGSVIEGSRGLYDGVDVEGSCSTAELAKMVRAPVVIVLDATKTTRTAAAMIIGLRELDRSVDIRGVILNKVVGARHETILRQSVERFAGVSVMGVLPRFEGLGFPERHLGLVPPDEHALREEAIEEIAAIVRRNVDADRLREVAETAVPLPTVYRSSENTPRESASNLRIGLMRDEAFHFYYPENLEALEERGAQIVTINALETGTLSDVDALYIGGGFPEIWAEGLAQNASLRREIRELADSGLPVYAECGGLMYLGEFLKFRGGGYPMVGALPMTSEFFERPQGHGYTMLETVGENPFFPCGTSLKGHEFHYSRLVALDESKVSFAFRICRGTGIDGRRDGITRENILATYTHVHALGCKEWIEGVVRCGERWKRQRSTQTTRGLSSSDSRPILRQPAHLNC